MVLAAALPGFSFDCIHAVLGEQRSSIHGEAMHLQADAQPGEWACGMQLAASGMKAKASSIAHLGPS